MIVTLLIVNIYGSDIMIGRQSSSKKGTASLFKFPAVDFRDLLVGKETGIKLVAMDLFFKVFQLQIEYLLW